LSLTNTPLQGVGQEAATTRRVPAIDGPSADENPFG
jgi:hypothetical protein